MKSLKHYIIGGAVFVLVVGTLTHFLYEWTGNNFVVGLFTPVNESVWEHMKLVFFPTLLCSFLLITKFGKEYPCMTSACCFGILLGACLVPALYYIYTGITGRDILILDLAVFAVSVIAAFVSIYRFAQSCRVQAWTPVLFLAVCAGIVCFLLFSYHPPKAAIFAPPSDPVRHTAVFFPNFDCRYFSGMLY